MIFDPNDWYWAVGTDADRVWSSRRAEYVALDDAGYAAWLSDGGEPTRIADEFELDQVLRQHGRSLGRVFTAAEVAAALVRIDGTRVRAVLGRQDVGRVRAGDADKLWVLAQEVQRGLVATGAATEPVEIEGATVALTPEERLSRLEEKGRAV